MPEPAVTLYVVPGCRWCVAARRFFEARGSTVAEFNLREMSEDFRNAVKLGGETVTPVVQIGVEIHVGYDESRWAEMLESPLPPAPPPEVYFPDEDEDEDDDLSDVFPPRETEETE